MNDLESRLAVFLKAGVGDPPGPVTVEAVRRQRARRLVVAAVGTVTAVALAAAVGASLAAGLGRIGSGQRPFADMGTASTPPPYYVSLDFDQVLTVRATATGQVTDTVAMPERWGGGGQRLDSALAAAADGRTFVVVYHSDSPYQIGVYRFTLTRAGQIAGLRLVRNGVMPGLAEMTAAVSRDGTRVAIAGVPGHDAHMSGWTHRATEIVVLNLRTGHRVTFATRNGRNYRWLFIGNLSWTNGGHDLAYLGRWCDQSIDGFNTDCAWSARSLELRLIKVTGSGGRFGGGRVILHPSQHYPVILQAVVTADGRSVLAITMTSHGDQLSVVRFSALTGKPTAVLYRGRPMHRRPSEAFLSADGSGHYFILDEDNGAVNAWVRHGVLHPLPLGRALPQAAPVW